MRTVLNPLTKRTTIAALALAVFMVVAQVSIGRSCETITIRTGQVGGVPGDGSAGGYDDSFRVFEGPCGTALSPGPFTAAIFNAAATSPIFAQVVEPIGPYVSSLIGDPDARWIASQRAATTGQPTPPRSVLYACRFELTSGCTEADITVTWSVDDRLGDTAGGANPIGIYLNGAPLPVVFSGGGYTGEYTATATAVPVAAGTNWLYVYQRDTLCAFSALILSASITCGAVPSEIHGTKYWDQDCDGVRDAGEPGLAGWVITASGPTDLSTTTGPDGSYAFLGVPPGTYTISETTTAPWILTEPAGGAYTVDIGCDGAVQGLDIGNCLCDKTPVPAPPPCIAGWYPLDDGIGTLAQDLASGNHGTLVGGPVWGTGYVGGSVSFPDATSYIETDPGYDPIFGEGSFAVAGWLRVDDSTPGTVRTLMDKRISGGGTTGFALTIDDQFLSLEIGAGTTTTYVATTTNLIDGEWHHFAAVVCRSPNEPFTNSVTLYVDGAEDAAPWTGAAVQTGNVDNPAPLRLGQASDGFPSSYPLHGHLDEVMLFDCCLDSLDVAGLPAITGFASSTCGVPSVLTPSGSSTTTYLEICNFAATSQDYAWTIAGLPAGGSCTIDGPSVFSPVAGTVTLPPGPSCITIPITVIVPPGLTPGNTACYQVTVSELSSGGCLTAFGTLKPPSLHFVDPIDPFVAVPTALPTTLGFEVMNPSSQSQVLPIEVHAWSEGHRSPSPTLSLDGLPPGEPVLRQVEVPAGETVEITVEATPIDFEPFNVNEVRLVADILGLGLPEPVEAIRVRSEHAQGTIHTEEGAGSVPAAQMAIGAAPNPFAAGTTVYFRLVEAGAVSVQIFDVVGRLVRDLGETRLTAGMQAATWDGRDSAGQPTPGGLYWIQVTSGSRSGVQKLVRLP